MKLSRELKTAILVIISILLFIWGYSFLKGRDLFVNYKRLYVTYTNVEGLTVAAPVTINGLTVGKVNSIQLDNTTGKLKVELQINTDFPITKNSQAEIYAPSPIGGKQIALKIVPNGPLAVDGDNLISATKLGLTEQLANEVAPLKDKVTVLLDNANKMMENLNGVLDAKTKENLQQSLANLNETIAQFKQTAAQTNSMLADNKTKLSNTLGNAEKISANFSKVSDSLAKIELGKTVKKLESTMASVNTMMADMNSGKGTMGKLLKDEAMYNNFTNTSKELELLLQDLRLNPTRYVNVSLFGKKNKPYVAPVNDTIKK